MSLVLEFRYIKEADSFYHMWHNRGSQYTPYENYTDKTMLSMREQNGKLVNLHANMTHQYKENITLQKECDLNQIQIESNTLECMNDLRICSSTKEKFDAKSDERILIRSIERLEGKFKMGQTLHKKSVMHQKKGQENLIQYHAHLNHLLRQTIEICAENIESIRKGQLTKHDMKELHEEMKRMVDAHAHNLTTPPQATPRRSGLLRDVPAAMVSEQYDI